MNNIDEKLQAKLRKLEALAERGVGGEKENARRMLVKLLARHGLTIHDLDVETRKIVWFTYADAFERRLASQILSKVLDDTNISAWRKGRHKQIGFELTPSEAIEFELHYEALKNALRSHFEDAYSAFLQANRVFAKSGSRDESWTERDERVALMAAAVEPTQILRRVGHQRGGDHA